MEGFASFTINNKYAEIIKSYNIEYDEYNKFYYKEGYGAYMGDVDKSIRNIKMLKEAFNGKVYKHYKNFVDMGYELVIGPGFPDRKGNINYFSVYCYNYKQILNRKDKKVRKLIKF